MRGSSGWALSPPQSYTTLPPRHGRSSATCPRRRVFTCWRCWRTARCWQQGARGFGCSLRPSFRHVGLCWGSHLTEFETRLWEANAVVTDGKVLFMGGWDNSGPMDSAELWDPLTDSSSPTSRMNTPRAASTATVLADGRVLVTGGYGNDRFGLVASAEIYDPSSGTWSSAGEMTTKRMGHTMTVLSDGRVLVVGGGNKATETYDPSTGCLSRAGRAAQRSAVPQHVGGVYDPATDTWSASTDAAR